MGMEWDGEGWVWDGDFAWVGMGMVGDEDF